MAWTDAQDEQPQKSGFYLVTQKYDTGVGYKIGWFDSKHSTWVHNSFPIDVKAWAELPPLYRRSKKKDDN